MQEVANTIGRLVQASSQGPLRPARDRWARLRVAALRARTTSSQRLATPSLDAAGSEVTPLSVNSIVFSKDRAMQLDACLRSIELWAPYTGPISVIYQTTSDLFATGYQLLDLSERVRLIRQSDDFRNDVMAALDPTGNYTVFHTDDDLFFRGPPAVPILPAGAATFSLRLGENTTYCYPFRRPQPLPATVGKGPVIAWDWTRAKDDFSYPMSLDGHILPTSLLLRMLTRARFSNPNELEDALHVRRYQAPSVMLAVRESCLVANPANIVSPTHRNRAGGDPSLSPPALNARFLAGDRIDVEAMDFSNVQGAHQEIPFVFKSAVTRG
jgi:hypothetical protein